MSAKRIGHLRLEAIGKLAARDIPVKPGPLGGRQSGVGTLAAYRGHHVGVHDAYKALRRRFPEAAEYLLRKFHMKPNGNIEL